MSLVETTGQHTSGADKTIEDVRVGEDDGSLDRQEKIGSLSRYNVTLLTPRKRAALLKAVCELVRGEYSYAPKVPWTFFDDAHQAILLVVPKAASRSMLDFFRRSMNSTEGLSKLHLMGKPLDLMQKKKVQVRFLTERFVNYTKVVAVRHPLQKFVSGYYTVVVNRQLYASTYKSVKSALKYPSRKVNGRGILTFPEFAEAFSRGLVPENVHYASVQFAALPCVSDISFVVKTETIEQDMPLLSEALDINDISVQHLHERNQRKLKGQAALGKFYLYLLKYDDMLFALQKSQPETFKWILDYFDLDFKMFGYTWDPVEGRSGCLYNFFDYPGC